MVLVGLGELPEGVEGLLLGGEVEEDAVAEGSPVLVPGGWLGYLGVPPEEGGEIGEKEGCGESGDMGLGVGVEVEGDLFAGDGFLVGEGYGAEEGEGGEDSWGLVVLLWE